MFGQVHAWHGLELSAAAEPSMLLALHVVQANPTSRHHEGASRVFRGARGADPHALRAGAVKCSHGCSFPVASALPSSLVVPVSILLQANFDAAYAGNRAPLPLYLHTSWLRQGQHVEGIRRFACALQRGPRGAALFCMPSPCRALLGLLARC